MNHEQIGKHTVKCFRCATYHMWVFNMVCAGACECDCRPVIFKPVLENSKMKCQLII